MKKICLSLVILICVATSALYAQAPSISWARCYGGSWSDFGYIIHQTSDGGYIAGGMSRSLNGDVVPAGHGSYDVWILKLSATGSVEWQKSLGGSLEETTYNILETPDGGYLFAGISNSNDGDVLYNTFSRPTWLVKLNSTGGIVWQKVLADRLTDICINPSGGYMFTGTEITNMSPSWSDAQTLVMKIDDTGGTIFRKTYGSTTGFEGGREIKPALGGGFIVVGTSYSDTGYIAGNHGNGDATIMKISDTGAVQWQHCVGGSEFDLGVSVCQGKDSIIFMASNTQSTDWDATGNHGNDDMLISTFSASGTHLWSKPIGSSAMDLPYSIRPYGENMAVIAGISRGNDFDMHKNNGLYDYWIAQISSGGILQWENSFGGTTEDSARYCEQTSDGGIIAIGSAFSSNGDIIGNHGQYDIWVAKLGGTTAVATIQPTNQYGITMNTAGNLLVSGPDFDKAVVYDVAGRFLLTEHSSTIPTYQLTPGTYLLAVYRRDGSVAFSSGFTR